MAASMRIISEYLCTPSLSIEEARAWIRRLAMAHSGIAEDRLVDDLEEVSGMPIAALAELSKTWLPKR